MRTYVDAHGAPRLSQEVAQALDAYNMLHDITL